MYQSRRENHQEPAGYLDGRVLPEFIVCVSVQQEEKFVPLVCVPCYVLCSVTAYGTDITDETQADILSIHLSHDCL